MSSDESPVGPTIVLVYLDARDEGVLLTLIDSMPRSDTLRRRTQHYGYYDDYRRRLFGKAGTMPFPPWLADLGNQICRDGWSDHAPDQCAVNEYSPGQGISPHVDLPDCYRGTAHFRAILSRKPDDRVKLQIL